MTKTKQEAMEELKKRAASQAEANCPPGSALVWGEGSLNAAIALVGEAPGEQETRQRRPFVGMAGQIYERQLSMVGISRQDVWTCSCVKCRPTRTSPSGGTVNRRPNDKEIQLWRPFLMEELAIIKPRVIVCMGSVAASTLLGKNLSITRARGKWFDGPNGSKAIVTFHPAYLRRATVAGQQIRANLFREDLQEALRASGHSSE